MPPKPKPKPKKKLTEALQEASIASPGGGVASPDVSAPSTTRGKRTTKVYKTPSIILSSDDEVTLSAKKIVPAVTVTKSKLKPGQPSHEIVDVSDSDEAVDEEGDDCENEPPVHDDDDVEDEGSLKEFLVDDEDGEDVYDPEEDAKLVGGDSMFVESKKTSSRIQLKRPAPRTPPYDTRRSSATFETPSRSPTKKARSGPAPSPMTPSPEKPKRKTAFPKSAPQAFSNDDLDTERAPVVASKTGSRSTANKTLDAAKNLKGKPAAPLPSVSSTSGPRTFAGLTEADMPGIEESDDDEVVQSKEVYHDDHRLLRIKELPAVCGVSDPRTQDKFLKEHGHYNNLPHLREVALRPLRKYKAVGLVRFSKWRKYIPEIKFLQLLEIVVFSRSGRFINPSRVDPLSVSGRPATWNDTRYELCTGKNVTAICVSPVMIQESYLDSYHSILKYSGHYVTGVLHMQEMNRMVSLAGMLLGIDEVHAQVWKDALTFGTKSQSIGKDGSSTDAPELKDMFEPTGSPIKAKSPPVNEAINAVEPFAYDDKIPVYDGIGREFPCNVDMFGNLSAHFEAFEGEIPANSCAVIGYILQMHKQADKSWRMYTYAKWILVLGLGK